MSSRSRSRRGVGRLVQGVGLLYLAAVLAGCGGGSFASASGGGSAAVVRPVAADGTTGRIALVEFERQCRVPTMSFPDEAGITADLDSALATAGLTHAQWKRWHDALARSPQLVTQLAALRTHGCPAQ